MAEVEKWRNTKGRWEPGRSRNLWCPNGSVMVLSTCCPQLWAQPSPIATCRARPQESMLWKSCALLFGILLTNKRRFLRIQCCASQNIDILRPFWMTLTADVRLATASPLLSWDPCINLGRFTKQVWTPFYCWDIWPEQLHILRRVIYHIKRPEKGHERAEIHSTFCSPSLVCVCGRGGGATHTQRGWLF